ncbi:ABC transporter substrate binding protein [Dongshaea marina]|uniref:ABC transporter substrate binding protein n=1 Tax=Dongshaea marina TaxID=2047966 RepID=UPI000D3E14D8|nr:ABC transporter substrate binding protein [Dongshaea marina]
MKMRSCLFAIFITLGTVSLVYAEYRVAIFDYDDRLNHDNTVAKYIEKQLKDNDYEILVSQFTGRGEVVKSVQILKNIDAMGFDLLITITSDALILARHAVHKTPIIFTNANNPALLGVREDTKAIGNITGATYYIPIQEKIEFFRKVQKNMKAVGVIFDKNNKSKRVEVKETRVALRNLNIKGIVMQVENMDEYLSSVIDLIDLGMDSIIITSSGLLYENIHLITQVTNDSKVAVYSYNGKAVPKGAIASLTSDYYKMADELVIPMALDVLLNKKQPRDMPIRRLKNNDMLINLSAAKNIGLTIDKEIIDEAINIGGKH